MQDDLTILNFDQVYENQAFLANKDYSWVDFKDIPNVNLFCERTTLYEIASRLDTSRNKITLIGNGNYHYITYFYLSKIQQPFTLVLFDHHTDTLKSPSEELISCGSWVLEAIHDIPNLKKVLFLGVSEDAEHHIPSSIESKIGIYTKHFLRLHFQKALNSILNSIPTKQVYLSIDKDVFDPKDAMTNWDHGNMRLKQLLKIVKEIIFHHRISGIDICGEYPIRSLNEFDHKAKEANDKNSYANQFMLYYIKRWLSKTGDPSTLLHA